MLYMKKHTRLFITLLISFLSYGCSSSQEIEWYYPWNNQINNITKVEQVETVPILLNGSNYRILKITSFKANNVNRITIFSNNSTVECFQLPIIKNYKKNQILDLIVPIKSEIIFEDKNSINFFLLKFKGIKPGNENITITISTDEKKYHIEKKISVSNDSFSPKLDLNVWAYFDYNFLVENIKNQIITDLHQHHVSTLVIPPYALPSTDNLSQDKIQKFRDYLKNTEGKFKYYILYLGGFQNTENNMMSTQWKYNFPMWYKSIIQVFNELNISLDKVLLYPIDEPRQNNTDKLINIYDYCKKIGIKNDFFVTLSNQGSEIVAKKVEYVQVHAGIPNLMKKVNSSKGNLTKIWIYETDFGESRNNEAYTYLKMGIKASYYSATGIGIWNYADTQSSITEQEIQKVKRGKATWELEPINPSGDYSLIYRKNDIIYSSLRWEALSYGIEENYWLDLHKKKFGVRLNKEIIAKLLKGNLESIKEWEAIKCLLIK